MRLTNKRCCYDCDSRERERARERARERVIEVECFLIGLQWSLGKEKPTVDRRNLEFELKV
jgi:hypothetical protein